MFFNVMCSYIIITLLALAEQSDSSCSIGIESNLICFTLTTLLLPEPLGVQTLSPRPIKRTLRM